MDAPGFEPSTLSIGLMIDWLINPLSHHGSVKLYLFAYACGKKNMATIFSFKYNAVTYVEKLVLNNKNHKNNTSKNFLIISFY